MVVARSGAAHPLGNLLGDLLFVDAEAGERVAALLAARVRRETARRTVRASTRAHRDPVEPDDARPRCLGDRANAYTLGEVEIGARATVAQEAYLSTGSHDFDAPGIPLVTGKITIGEDVFLGARVFVMPGVSVGPRSVVGACSVITKDIPPDSIAVGNPCRVVRARQITP
jgi:hypothetical protein